MVPHDHSYDNVLHIYFHSVHCYAYTNRVRGSGPVQEEGEHAPPRETPVRVRFRAPHSHKQDTTEYLAHRELLYGSASAHPNDCIRYTILSFLNKGITHGTADTLLVANGHDLSGLST